MKNRLVTVDKPTNTGTDFGGYYGTDAYCPGSVPEQPVQSQDFNHSKLGRSAGFRLPWGGAQDVMPSNLFARWPPKALREIERIGNLLEEAGQQDHQSI